jgi:hypothetical protein
MLKTSYTIKIIYLVVDSVSVQDSRLAIRPVSHLSCPIHSSVVMHTHSMHIMHIENAYL